MPSATRYACAADSAPPAPPAPPTTVAAIGAASRNIRCSSVAGKPMPVKGLGVCTSIVSCRTLGSKRATSASAVCRQCASMCWFIWWCGHAAACALPSVPGPPKAESLSSLPRLLLSVTDSKLVCANSGTHMALTSSSAAASASRVITARSGHVSHTMPRLSSSVCALRGLYSSGLLRDADAALPDLAVLAAAAIASARVGGGTKRTLLSSSITASRANALGPKRSAGLGVVTEEPML
mmetsp:Transcript_5580/g.19950  ORF Transcript_5580/g.19950 Transcript_5580/m.19950 type:complete len:238 (+) Transcript_5580:248-961(+)